jgi:hypothetical protein
MSRRPSRAYPSVSPQHDATMRHLLEHHHLLAREMVRLIAFAHDHLEMDQIRGLLEPASLGPSGDGLEDRINSCLEQCRHILTVADRDHQTVSKLYDAPVVNNTKELRSYTTRPRIIFCARPQTLMLHLSFSGSVRSVSSMSCWHNNA